MQTERRFLIIYANLTMTANKKTTWIIAFGNLSAKDFNFFYPTHIAPFERIREHSYQRPMHIAAHLQAPQANAQSEDFQKNCNFAPAP